MSTDAIETVQQLLIESQEGDEKLAILRMYRFDKLLGVGGMGAVCSLNHIQTNETIAIKLMLSRAGRNTAAEQRFVREISNLAALDHKNLVHFHGAGASAGIIFLLMEYCSEGSLDDLLDATRGALDVQQSLSIIQDVLDGLEYGHQAQLPDIQLADGTFKTIQGLVHRDLKPQNIFFSAVNGMRVAKVGDFGLAKPYLLAGLSGITETGEAWGTPEFMPRQQVEDFKYVGPEVDVWAAAACLYQMLTGTTPRDFPANRDRWWVVLNTPPVDIRQRGQAIPDALANLLNLALDDSSELHFRSVLEFREELIK